jgi:hypothetical protein
LAEGLDVFRLRAAATGERRLPSGNLSFVGVEVLTTVNTELVVFLDVAPCSLIALMMEAVRTSETLVNLYQTTWRYKPDNSHYFG